MKQNKYYQLTVLTFLCLLLTGLPARAQRPQTSTDEAPVWYYIQVMGDGDRTDRVMTELDNGNVYGRALIDSDNAAGAAAQLWRAEADGSNYRFVNRRSGRYMNVSHEANRRGHNVSRQRHPLPPDSGRSWKRPILQHSGLVGP